MSVITFAIQLQRKVLKTLKSDSGGIEPIYIYILGPISQPQKTKSDSGGIEPICTGNYTLAQKSKSDSVGIELTHQLLVHAPIPYIVYIIHTIHTDITKNLLNFEFFFLFYTFVLYFGSWSFLAGLIRNTRRYLGVRCEYTPFTMGVFTLDFKIDV